MALADGVSVFLDEAVHVVGHVQRVVADDELGLAKSGLLEHLVGGRLVEVLVHLFDPGGVVTGRQTGLLVQQGQHTHAVLDKVDAGLVVGKVYEQPLDLLLDVLFLLQLEHVLVELLLQLLVGVVDAELLERVLLEVLESVDIKHSNERVDVLLHLRRTEVRVDVVHEPVEQRRINIFGKRVSGHERLLVVQVGDDLFRTRGDLFLDTPLCERARVDAQKRTCLDQVGLVGGQLRVVAGGGDVDVTDVEQRGQDLVDLALARLVDADERQRVVGELEVQRVVDAGDCSGTSLV
ncbi:hypothetical protein PUMCH_004579 [Australozyma saopauloensis]|uniref:Uncharacterized protein n=1 Tax=Australozyma saopauloensis TaxID=291208 RepID=A0AAX4HG25_9ASCO|nr:hypothetical protein PUMCH_004579 [[Candida] saopauloensis]